MVSNSDYQGSGGTTKTVMKTPVFSTLNYTAANLNFEHFFNSLSDDAFVQISTDNSTWTTLADYTTDQGTEVYNIAGDYYEEHLAPATLAIPAAFLNQPTVWVRFRYVSAYGFWWAVDNVNITGTIPNNIAWTATPSLNAGLPGAAGTASLTNIAISVTPTAGGIYTYSAVASGN